ncbi:MAG: hypothetical protein K6T87_16155 [Roseiflexus sp.]|uniref:ferritin family protein n=1 Tax=Roseiflexus sp. TaxID=2562120 RepID=UPI0025E14400|nr:ferritin family protein [Roseiflexus sp.]MCL6542090.1 hypothetical protein [Roseiflexus sp.]
MAYQKRSWIDRLMDDEKQGISEYMELAEVLKAMGYPQLSSIAVRIANDEKYHIKLLKKIRDSIE